MNSIKFDEYYNNVNVIKFNNLEGGLFYNKENEIIILFSFFHTGLNSIWRDAPNKRIDFQIYKSQIYTGPKPLYKIENEKLFLVNSKHPDFGILFKSTIDKEKNIARIELVELPELGTSLITDEEKNGLEVKF